MVYPLKQSEKSKRKLHNHIQNIFVKIETNNGVTSIAFSTMNKQQGINLIEQLQNRTSRSLHTFSARNTDTNMCLQNHGNIVCSIAYRECSVSFGCFFLTISTISPF